MARYFWIGRGVEERSVVPSGFLVLSDYEEAKRIAVGVRSTGIHVIEVPAECLDPLGFEWYRLIYAAKVVEVQWPYPDKDAARLEGITRQMLGEYAREAFVPLPRADREEDAVVPSRPEADEIRRFRALNGRAPRPEELKKMTWRR